MPKAMLIIDMPESCKECDFQTFTFDKDGCPTIGICMILDCLEDCGTEIYKTPNDGKRPDCPLKPLKEVK